MTIMDKDFLDLRYGATYGILDIFSPWAPDGAQVNDWFEEFTNYLKNTLKWSYQFPCRSEEDGHSGHHGYRILDTFMSDAFEYGFLKQLLKQTQDPATRAPVRFLLMDPVGSLAASRSRSLKGDSMSRGRDGLVLLHKAICSLNTAAEISDLRASDTSDGMSLRELARAINILGEPYDIEVRFHNVYSSGISYFFKDVLIRGTTPAMQSSLDGMWDRVVNDPYRDRDRYDQFSLEFNELWDHAAQAPGEESGDPNSVFISYAHEDRELVSRLKEHLETPHVDDDGTETHLQIFWDQHMKVGDDWKERIRTELNASGTMIVVVTNRELGQWVLAEVGHFWAASKKIIPLLNGVGADDLPDLIDASHAKTLEDDAVKQRELFDELREVLLDKALPNQTVGQS